MVNYICNFKIYLLENKNASENTVVSYLRDVNEFNDHLSALGIKGIRKCSEKNVRLFIEHLDELGKSNSTKIRALASLRAFFSYLTSNGIVKSNPARNIKFERVEKRPPRVLTNEEVDLFLSQPKCDSLKGYRDKAMLELLYATGIRVSELIELDLSDINLNLGFVRCTQKNGERIVPIYPAAVFAVSEYIKKARPLLVANPDEIALFVNLNGARMTRQGFWKIIKYYQESANIETEITPHVLRHSFATHLLQNGADVGVIKEMMGHSDISSTLVYTKLIKNEVKSEYIKFHPRA